MGGREQSGAIDLGSKVEEKLNTRNKKKHFCAQQILLIIKPNKRNFNK